MAALCPLPTARRKGAVPVPPFRRAAVLACVGLLLALLACPHAALAQYNNAGGAELLTEKQRTRAVTEAIDHHSFSPPLLRAYYGDGEIPHWTVSGSSVITDHYVRLTPEASSSTGHMWNTEPLDMEAFEIVVGFRVAKVTPGTSADGFAIWITTQPPRVNGPIFGHPMSFDGAAVIFDTYDNDNMKDNPMVGLLYNTASDANRQYSPSRDYRGEMRGNCLFDFRNVPSPRLATARLRYENGNLQVYVARSSEDDEKLCFSSQGIDLQTARRNYYIGVTASTGGVWANHDIVFFHLTPLAGHQYDHDVRQARNAPGGTGAATATNIAFQNYEHRQEEQQQQQQPPQQQEQQQPPQQQQQQQPPQQQQQYQQPPPPPPPPSHPPPPPPPQQQYEQQQQQQYQQQQQQQQQYHQQQQHQQQYEQHQQQQQQQYQQPPPPPPPQQQQPPPMDEVTRLQMLEREIAALRRQQAQQKQQQQWRGDGDNYDDYDDDDDGGDDRNVRRRRARTNRRRGDY